jgi:hypothetical protein
MGQSAGEPRLVRVDTPGREEHVIPEGTTRIGRSRGSDICLRDSAVSRFHCYLLREGDVVRVFDGESKNPARVDGKPADGQVLRSGHTLRVGKCEFVYEGPLPARPGPGAATRPAARPADAPRRRPARPARPPIAAFVIVLLLVPAAAWLIVKGFPEKTPGKQGAGPAPPPEDAAARRVERTAEGLELRIAELLRAEAAYRKDAARAADDRKIEELSREIADLRAELERAQAREAAPPVAPPLAAVAPRGAEPQPGEYGAVRVDGVEREPTAAPSRAGKTEVAATRPPPRRRSPKEIGALVAALRARIDDYATHAITAKSLEPELSDLTRTAGKDGADAMLDVHAHARGLERQVEASIDENRRRSEALLRAAAAAPPPASSSKEKKGYSHGPAPGAEREANQRLLELSRKAAEIHAVHLEHLRPLVAAVLRAIGTMEDPAALDHLRLRLVSERDGGLTLAILRALEAGRHRGAVPVLVRRLANAQDPGLREAIRKALAAIAGVDLGDRPGPWEEWWAREGE